MRLCLEGLSGFAVEGLGTALSSPSEVIAPSRGPEGLLSPLPLVKASAKTFFKLETKR